MKSVESDIFLELKKKFYRSGYSDKYGGSIFATFVIIIHYSISSLLSNNEKCV